MDELPDPAAIFACAKSLHDACLERAELDSELKLSEAFQGMDQLMREVMRVGEMFENWACFHVAFDELVDVWPYLLDERFGATCLEVMDADFLAGFDDDDCLRIAFKLRLPIRVDGSLHLPVDVRATNPFGGGAFQEFRIQTVRNDLVENVVVPYTEDDDPFDENFEIAYFGIYGVNNDGLMEHIADRRTYLEALSLTRKLAPGIDLPSEPVCFRGANNSLLAAGPETLRR